MTLVEIKTDPHKGRCFTLKGNVTAGTTLLSCIPYGVVPDSHSKRRVCAACLKWSEPSCPPPFLHYTCHSTYSNVEAIPGSRTASLLELFYTRQPIDSCNVVDKDELIRVGPPCHHVFYCSMECSERDWREYHAVECSFFYSFFGGIPSPLLFCNSEGSNNQERIRNQENYDSYTLDFMWLLMRILIKKAKECSIKQDIPGPTFDQVWESCDNFSCFPQDKLDLFTRVAKTLFIFIKQHLLVAFPTISIQELLPRVNLNKSASTPDQELLDSLLVLICKEECNSFGLYTFKYLGPYAERQGYALSYYPEAVYFNHSCAPNIGHKTVYTSNGPEMQFYSLVDLKKGVELNISYLALNDFSFESLPSQMASLDLDLNLQVELEDGKERRELLKSYFFFDCNCEKCSWELNPHREPLPLFKSLLSHILCRKNQCQGRFIPISLRKDSGKDFSKNGNVNPILWQCEACGNSRDV